MARVARNTDTVFSIDRWLGLNEAPAGAGALKMGEAAVMKNFRVTSEGLLGLRGGLRSVLALADAHVASAGEARTLRTDERVCGFYTLYPYFTVAADGTPSPSGTPARVGYAESAAAAGWCMAAEGGGVLALAGCGKREAELAAGASRTFSIGSSQSERVYHRCASVTDEGKIVLWGETRSAFFPYLEGEYDCRGWYYGLSEDGKACLRADSVWPTDETDYAGLTLFEERRQTVTALPVRYEWRFSPLTVSPAAGTDWTVRGLWSGALDGAEKLIAAAGGALWQINEENGVFSAQSLGAVDTSSGVAMFGFGGKLYILDGAEYRVLSGAALSVVEGYVPCVAAATPPAGGGRPLERVNLLTGKKRQRFSPDGASAVFKLAENDIASVDSVRLDGVEQSGFTVSLADGSVTLPAPPAEGVDNLEIAWSKGAGSRASVCAMRLAEIFSGRSDARVFLGGDGTNTLVYSDLDGDGRPTAEYFPALNHIAVDSGNTPVTALIRHHDRLISFKPDGAFATVYDSFTLSDGTLTAGFLTSALHRGTGCSAPGQAALVLGDPRTLCAGSVWDWRLTGSAVRDERYARDVGARVRRTLAGFDAASCVCFDDEAGGEYYILCGGRALVHNYARDLWYLYEDFPVTRMARWRGRLVCGGDGALMLLEDDCRFDCGRAISARWESGDMDFGAPWRLKHSSELWLSVKPEEGTRLAASVVTDRGEGERAEAWPALFSFRSADFAALSFTSDPGAQVLRLRLRAKKFHRYRLVLETAAPGCAVSVLGADVRVRNRGIVK